jgi:hypothetical protein
MPSLLVSWPWPRPWHWPFFVLPELDTSVASRLFTDLTGRHLIVYWEELLVNLGSHKPTLKNLQVTATEVFAPP